MPLQSLASRWMPARSARRVHSSGLRYVGVRPSLRRRAGRVEAGALDGGASAARGAHGRCRSAPAATSRMVISGRMADVCAELDRLAALEDRAT